MEGRINRDRKIVVKYINKKVGMSNFFEKNHITYGGMLDGSTLTLVPNTRRGVMDAFLTDEEVKVLSKELNKDIAFTNKVFWEDYSISLGKDQKILDLKNAYDYIEYKLLLQYPSKICSNPELLGTRGTYQWCLYNTEEEANAESKLVDNTIEAAMALSSVGDDKDKLRYLYKYITGRAIDSTSKLVDIKAKFKDILIKESAKMVKLCKDPLVDIKTIINTATDYGVIKTKDGQFCNGEDMKPLAKAKEKANLENAARFLNNPVNNELLMKIEDRLNIAKEVVR